MYNDPHHGLFCFGVSTRSNDDTKTQIFVCTSDHRHHQQGDEAQAKVFKRRSSRNIIYVVSSSDHPGVVAK